MLSARVVPSPRPDDNDNDNDNNGGTPAKASTRTSPSKTGRKKVRRRNPNARDPRWNTEGFNRWCTAGEIAWVKVGHLRELERQGQPWCRRSEMPPEALHVGAPPPAEEGVRLYAASLTAQCHASKAASFRTSWHSDRSGERRRQLVKVLDDDGASNEDLVFDWFMSTYQHGSEPLSATVHSAGIDTTYGEHHPRPAVMLLFEGDKALTKVPDYLLVSKVSGDAENAEATDAPEVADAVEATETSTTPTPPPPHLAVEDLQADTEVLAYRPVTEREKAIYERHQTARNNFLVSYFRLNTIVLDITPKNTDESDGSTATTATSRGYFDSAWTRAYDLHFTSFAQRLVNHADAAMRAKVSMEQLFGSAERLRANDLWAQTPASELPLITKRRRELQVKMPPARTDAVGFRVSCRRAGYRWVKVWFIHELAAQPSRPAPRCQDLPVDAFVVGEPPAQCQPFVVSHSWASSKHFSPGGQKIRELSEALNRLDANNADVVFLDYMSIPQAAPAEDGQMPAIYFEANAISLPAAGEVSDAEEPAVADPAPADSSTLAGLISIPDRTEAETDRFEWARRESTRLYAFAGGTVAMPNGATQEVVGCKVIVLPHVDDVKSFPGFIADGDVIERRLNEACDPPREEEWTDWGFAKSIDYASSGWACTEYTIARYNGTIANAQDMEVLAVDLSRNWPENAVDFEALIHRRADSSAEGGHHHNDQQQPELDHALLSSPSHSHKWHGMRHPSDAVHFSNKGDRDAVRFTFLKHAHTLGQGHEVPTFEMKGKAYTYQETAQHEDAGYQEWVARGAGPMRIMRNRETEELRLVLRDRKTKQVTVSTRVNPSIPVTKMAGSDRSVVFTCRDSPYDVLAFKCSSVEDADEFMNALAAAQAAVARLEQPEDVSATDDKKREPPSSTMLAEAEAGVAGGEVDQQQQQQQGGAMGGEGRPVIHKHNPRDWFGGAGEEGELAGATTTTEAGIPAAAGEGGAVLL